VNVARVVGAPATFAALQPRLQYDQMFLVIGAGFFLAAALLWAADLRSHQQRIGALQTA
jgi:hypothetical protein